MLRFSSATLIALLTLAGTAHAAPSVATVPNYNVKAACRALSLIPEAKEWSQFAAADRAMCVAVSGAGSVNPVYTELMTCLEMARDSEQSAKPNTQAR
jgi:homoserine kinase